MFTKLRASIFIFLLTFAFGAAAQSPSENKTPTVPKQPSSASDSNQGVVQSSVEKYLRNVYAWGPSFVLKIGTMKPSPIPDLLEIPVTISKDGQSDDAIVYATKDGKFIVRGEIDDVTVDPLTSIRSKLHPGNSPSMGPENAKVTLIEFADFECPSCRDLDRILRDFMHSHPDMRLVFKHFPLTEIHPWAMTAAIASQCTYQQDPKKFWSIHDAIFDAQDLITPSNVWDKMMDLAAKQGLNIDAFRTCMSSPEATRQVEQSMEEGRAVDITGTPTTFVNGRRVVGPDTAQLDQYTMFETK